MRQLFASCSSHNSDPVMVCLQVYVLTERPTFLRQTTQQIRYALLTCISDKRCSEIHVADLTLLD